MVNMFRVTHERIGENEVRAVVPNTREAAAIEAKASAERFRKLMGPGWVITSEKPRWWEGNLWQFRHMATRQDAPHSEPLPAQTPQAE